MISQQLCATYAQKGRIIMKFIKEHKSIVTVAGIALLLLGFLFVGNMIVMNKTESAVKAEAKGNIEQDAASLDISKDCAQYYLEDMPDCPLLKEAADGEYVNYGNSCLENSVNDINVANTAGKIIIKICEENGIDAKTAKVKDLTVEQIAEIDQEVFKTSEHGK